MKLRNQNKKSMAIFNYILEIIISPFTFIYRSRLGSKDNRNVQFFITALVAILITAVIVFGCYFAKDVFEW